MDWTGWIATAKEKAREHIILGLFALIALLLLVIWQAVPREVWGKVSEAVPKQALWALLGLEAIAIGIQAAFALDNRRKWKNTPPAPPPPPEPGKPLRRFGVHWDGEFNPLCPVCEILLHMFYLDVDESREALRCPKCKAEYTLRDDEGYTHALGEVKEYLSGKTSELY